MNASTLILATWLLLACNANEVLDPSEDECSNSEQAALLQTNLASKEDCADLSGTYGLKGVGRDLEPVRVTQAGCKGVVSSSDGTAEIEKFTIEGIIITRDNGDVGTIKKTDDWWAIKDAEGLVILNFTHEQETEEEEEPMDEATAEEPSMQASFLQMDRANKECHDMSGTYDMSMSGVPEATVVVTVTQNGCDGMVTASDGTEIEAYTIDGDSVTRKDGGDAGTLHVFGDKTILAFPDGRNLTFADHVD